MYEITCATVKTNKELHFRHTPNRHRDKYRMVRDRVLVLQCMNVLSLLDLAVHSIRIKSIIIYAFIAWSNRFHISRHQKWDVLG